MKLLVLAQTPPPLHGQSLMVQTLVAGLPGQGIVVRHVNLPLSRTSDDIGRARPGKVLTAVRAGLAARRAARRESCDVLYYVPAPGKRAALWRDIILLGLARPACPRLVLHWHASGLGEWLSSAASELERRLAHARLGHADLAIALSENLLADAGLLQPRKTAVVANGIEDPGGPVPAAPPVLRGPRRRVLFLGALSADKGVLVLIEAVARLRAAGAELELVLAGAPASAAEAAAIEHTAAPWGDAVQRPGFVTGLAKAALFRSADIFCLPTHYPHEAQPLVLLEALAQDLPIVATQWRGIPAMLPPGNPVVPPHDPAALAAGLAEALRAPPPPGANRGHFLARFTRERHLEALATALRSLEG